MGNTVGDVLKNNGMVKDIKDAVQMSEALAEALHQSFYSQVEK